MYNQDIKKPYIYLNSFLVKEEYKNLDLNSFIKDISSVNSYEIDPSHEFEGSIFVKLQQATPPKWKFFAEKLTNKNISDLNNLSSSAVLIAKSQKNTMIFSFGYGRFLIDTKYLVPDFGIKTALNTLDHKSLRSVDLLTLDEQAVQKKSQASREASASVFGIDISKDVLRAVTGSARSGVRYKNISGGDAIYSFGIDLSPSEIPSLVDEIFELYSNNDYKQDFYWVDNIRRLKDSSEINSLENILIDDIKSNHPTFTITIPEIIEWDRILGFSFTRGRSEINPSIDVNNYLKNTDLSKITIDTLKSDKLFSIDANGEQHDYKIYNSIYFECIHNNKNNVLFNGVWYEVDQSFSSRIDSTISKIQFSDIKFPSVDIKKQNIKGKDIEVIETEGDYNSRVSKTLKLHLLDKKLIKTSRKTTSIELCDLLSNNREFIHVKHRKGGSAGLSHLFAQGYVSSELILADKEFRKEARKKLKRIKPGLEKKIALEKINSADFTIVYLILGAELNSVLSKLPFFSKINLVNYYESLTQRGFNVRIAAAEFKKTQYTNINTPPAMAPANFANTTIQANAPAI